MNKHEIKLVVLRLRLDRPLAREHLALARRAVRVVWPGARLDLLLAAQVRVQAGNENNLHHQA